jgi:putative flippase GtrA
VSTPERKRTPPRSSHTAHLRRFLAFAVVSGLGLILDFVIYTALCESGMQPEFANLISAACGVTFVFFAASRHVFETAEGWLFGPFAMYAGWQVLLIVAASAAVGALTDLFDGRYLLGKLAVVPFTLTLNFLVSQRLLTRRGAGAVRA